MPKIQETSGIISTILEIFSIFSVFMKLHSIGRKISSAGLNEKILVLGQRRKYAANKWGCISRKPTLNEVKLTSADATLGKAKHHKKYVTFNSAKGFLTQILQERTKTWRKSPLRSPEMQTWFDRHFEFSEGTLGFNVEQKDRNPGETRRRLLWLALFPPRFLLKIPLSMERQGNYKMKLN